VRAGELTKLDLGDIGRNWAFQGGLGDGRMVILHPYDAIEGAIPITKSGLCAGGRLDEMKAVVAEGGAQASDFKVVVGCDLIQLQPIQSTGSDSGSIELGFKDMPGCVIATGDAVRDLALLPAML